MELEALQETAAGIKARGASLVVISPQLEKYGLIQVPVEIQQISLDHFRAKLMEVLG
jgi:hypothetical protein